MSGDDSSSSSSSCEVSNESIWLDRFENFPFLFATSASSGNPRKSFSEAPLESDPELEELSALEEELEKSNDLLNPVVVEDFASAVDDGRNWFTVICRAASVEHEKSFLEVALEDKFELQPSRGCCSDEALWVKMVLKLELVTEAFIAPLGMMLERFLKMLLLSWRVRSSFVGKDPAGFE